MTPFSDIKRDFAWAVLDVEAVVPAPLVGRSGSVTSGKTVTRRFGVYRNNVYASLVDAFASRFPVTARLVGEEFFQAMVRSYVGCEPPRSAVLLRYGASFADFVAQFSPAGSVPYLADVARLEWAWHAAYHAEDAAPMTLAELTEAAPIAEDSTLALHPSLAVVRAPFPVVTIWQIVGREEEDEVARLPVGGEDALVARPKLDVEVRRLPEGGAVFVLALQGGASLHEAASSAMQDAPAFDLKANLAGLITSGAIVSVR
ncbi:MAG: putative DNA-binding domain-containing protein [Methyloceanibacter sp.]|nr:putative DNA-binding domain-containing protein [Methyloceanibacter sp.]